MNITDFEVDSCFENKQFCVSSIDHRATSSNKPYSRLILSDRTGSIACNIWDTHVDKSHEGEVMVATGKVTSYNNTKQLRLSSYDFTPLNNQNISEVLTVSKYSSQELKSEIGRYIAKVENKTYRTLLDRFFEHDHYNRLFFLQKASVSIHQDFIGGLAEHTLALLKLADAVADDTLNMDLLYTGIIFHDMGKIYEYDDNITKKSYTVAGRMLGHIAISIMILTELAGKDIDPLENEDCLLLFNAILSHHGKLEWGSPVTPKTKEAFLLHKIDEFDAKRETISKALSDTSEGEFTSSVFGADGNIFYNPKKD